MSEQIERDDDTEPELVKRYIPVAGIGTFLCVHCIVEAAKSFVLDEFPEIMQIETHLEDEEYDDVNEMTQLAMRCMLILAKKFLPSDNIMFIDAGQLINNKHPGAIFIGRNYEDMDFQETKINFIERTKKDLMNFQVFNNNNENENKDNLTKETPEDIAEHEHELDQLEIGPLVDVCITFSEKEDEDDMDDYDHGREAGIEEGIDANYERVQVALYKMFKNKKIKNLDFLIDEIHDTICGMNGDDFEIWQKNYGKYMNKRKAKLEKLEKGEENG